MIQGRRINKQFGKKSNYNDWHIGLRENLAHISDHNSHMEILTVRREPPTDNCTTWGGHLINILPTQAFTRLYHYRFLNNQYNFILPEWGWSKMSNMRYCRTFMILMILNQLCHIHPVPSFRPHPHHIWLEKIGQGVGPSQTHYNCMYQCLTK